MCSVRKDIYGALYGSFRMVKGEAWQRRVHQNEWHKVRGGGGGGGHVAIEGKDFLSGEGGRGSVTERGHTERRGRSS